MPNNIKEPLADLFAKDRDGWQNPFVCSIIIT
jgi:hypothetical protein